MVIKTHFRTLPLLHPPAQSCYIINCPDSQTFQVFSCDFIILRHGQDSQDRVLGNTCSSKLNFAESAGFFRRSLVESIVDYLLAARPWVSEQPYPLQIIVSIQKSVIYKRTKDRSRKGKGLDWRKTLNGQKGIINKSTKDSPNFRVSKAHLSVTLLQHADTRLVRRSGEPEGRERPEGILRY